MDQSIVTAISITVAVFGFVVALATYIRGGTKDAKKEASENAENEGRVLARLDSIDDGIRDIKAENRSMRNEIREVRDIAQHAKERADAANNRLDRLHNVEDGK